MSAQIEMRSVAEIVRDMLLQPRLNWIEEYAHGMQAGVLAAVRIRA